MKCCADKGSYCSELLKKECEGCGFFRTEEDLEESRNRALNRIDSLPKTTKNYIYQTYFKGEK